jgi:hypothetical protein
LWSEGQTYLSLRAQGDIQIFDFQHTILILILARARAAIGRKRRTTSERVSASLTLQIVSDRFLLSFLRSDVNDPALTILPTELLLLL